MAKPTFVLALDIATKCGWARGVPGSDPEFGSVRFGNEEVSDNAVYFRAIQWANTFFAQEPKPHVLVLERMLPPTAVSGKTQTRTLMRLAGLHGVIRGMAFGHGIYQIDTVPVGSVRSHFIGQPNLTSERAKKLVMQQCMKLGWNPADDDQGDALALWDYYCCKLDPKLAIRRTPLFWGGVAI